MERVEISKIIQHVPHETVRGDHMDYYLQVYAHEIFYTEDSLNVAGVILKVVNGRFAFAKSLELWHEPKMCSWPQFMMVADNTLYDGEVQYGQFNVIGGAGFGYVRQGEEILRMPHIGHVEIGKRVTIHNHVCIDRGVIGPTVIGDDSKIDNFCHIAHGAKIGRRNTLAAHTILEGSVQVGDDNTFGTGVIVQKKVIIGNNNLFGSGCVVTKPVGDNGIYVGNPARFLRSRL
jgi:UDP-3-O-[3-hydroxymyristoyl] glucosamine N-acyltransferase